MLITLHTNTKLDYAVAEDLFGWEWLAYRSRPTRNHPDYYTENATNVLVRRFFPPLRSLDSIWAVWRENKQPVPAKGDEPLAYCYESSAGPHPVPQYSSDFGSGLVLKEIKRRRIVRRFAAELQASVGSNKIEKLLFATPEQKCIAALAAVDSKHIQRVPA